jgi:IPT/TIG domain-containing protein
MATATEKKAAEQEAAVEPLATFAGGSPVPVTVAEEAARVTRATAGIPNKADAKTGDLAQPQYGVGIGGKPGQWLPWRCAAPLNAADATSLGVTANPTTAWTNGQFIQCRDGSFAYWTGSAWAAGKCPYPTVTVIQPNVGGVAGGTAVTIMGAGFTGATAVTVGGVACTGVTVVSDTKITCTTGAHAAGAVAVAVTTPSGTGTLAGGFTYQ